MSVAVQPNLFGVEQTARTSDDYYTPAWVFERMGLEFDLDVAAPPGGIPWIPAKRFFTMEDDGLAQNWHGRVWMNPPYSACTPWVDKFINHRHGVCLLPWAKSAWTIRLWGEADAVVLPERWFHFAVSEGSGSISSAVFLAAFGDECVEAIQRVGRCRR